MERLKINDRNSTVSRVLEEFADYEDDEKVQKDFWPNYYTEKYGINNLWRLRLDNH